VAFSPGEAEAVPTAKDLCAYAMSGEERKMRKQASGKENERSMKPPEAVEHTATKDSRQVGNDSPRYCVRCSLGYFPDFQHS
jgi:hypothetical protein